MANELYYSTRYLINKLLLNTQRNLPASEGFYRLANILRPFRAWSKALKGRNILAMRCSPSLRHYIQNEANQGMTR